MDIQKLSGELQYNCETNINRLSELFKAFDLAKLGYDAQEAHIVDLYNEVLKEHTFYASKDCERLNKKAGIRVEDEQDTFLLSKSDFEKFLELTTQKLAKAGITDVKGYYITNWLTIKMDAKRELVNFIIDNIIPKDMRSPFEGARRNVVYQDKLLDTIRPTLNLKAEV